MPHALIIDDDERIVDAIQERLRSLDHTCDCALSQEEAEDFLKKTAYDYILLDLAIPVKFRGIPDKQYGRNLLRKIRRMRGLERTPVIVMTAHDLGSYHLGVEVMKDGAVDFVGKPFGDDHPLEEKIRAALEKFPPVTSPRKGAPASENPAARPAKPFPGGIMDFYGDRVELCGVRVCGAEGRTQSRKILDLLRRKRATADKRNYDGNFVAGELGFERGQSAVIETVREIRKTCAGELREKLGLDCGKGDVIVNRKNGYALADHIQIREGGLDPGAAQEAGLSRNQMALMRELRRKSPLAPKTLRDALDLNAQTLEKEISPLIARGYVKVSGNGAATRYHMANDPHPPGERKGKK